MMASYGGCAIYLDATVEHGLVIWIESDEVRWDSGFSYGKTGQPVLMEKVALGMISKLMMQQGKNDNSFHSTISLGT